MKMKNETYDILKRLCTIILPALGTLYFTLSQLWGLPYGEQVVGTLAAVSTFIGVCIGISTAAYNKEVI